MERRDFIATTGLFLGTVSASGLVHALNSGVYTARSRQHKLSSLQMALITTLSDLIIPRTDTPGALEAGVPEFVRGVVSDWYTDSEFNVFATGLQWLENSANKRFRCSYVRCRDVEKTTLLQEMEADARDYHRAHPPEVTSDSVAGKGAIDEFAPFFTKIKELVVIGYYTSELAAQTEMVYLPIPMKYAGEATASLSGDSPRY